MRAQVLFLEKPCFRKWLFFSMADSDVIPDSFVMFMINKARLVLGIYGKIWVIE
jgi:hypothetical protein